MVLECGVHSIVWDLSHADTLSAYVSVAIYFLLKIFSDVASPSLAQHAGEGSDHHTVRTVHQLLRGAAALNVPAGGAKSCTCLRWT